MSCATRIQWPAVIERAAAIVNSYDTSVTLRQLFYRLVASQVLPNTHSTYKALSDRTAKARRAGSFPGLIDRGRKIHRPASWRSPIEVVTAARDTYRRDRTENQDVSIYLGVEKAGMVVQLESWFGHLGIPILALGGYSSQTYVEDVTRDVARYRRQALLLYAGDFDPSGEDIDRDFEVRTGCWDEVVRVALTAEQVQDHELPINAGKTTDSRAAAFTTRHGELIQVELDALPPETLHSLYGEALDEYWDQDAYERVMEHEAEDRERMGEVLESMRGATDE